MVSDDGLRQLADDRSSKDSELNDVSAIGSIVTFGLGDNLRAEALYRTEVRGYKSSACHSWGFGISKFLP